MSKTYEKDSLDNPNTLKYAATEKAALEGYKHDEIVQDFEISDVQKSTHVVGNEFSEYLFIPTIARDAAKICIAITKDYQNGTKSNTIKCGVGISSRWIGGYVGATAGKCLGSLIIPKVGPTVGGIFLTYMGVKYGYKYGMSLYKKCK